MLDFLKQHKTFVRVAIGVFAAIVLAVVLAFALVKGSKEVFSNEKYMSHINSDAKNTNEESNLSVIQPTESDTESKKEEEKGIPLIITSPQKNDTTVSESSFAITGTSDPQKQLTMNGNVVKRLESGEFSVEVKLDPGKNTFVFEYDGKSVTYVIRYTFTVIKAYAPYEKQSYEAGSSFVVVASARVNCSSVTATFNGKTITLSPQKYKEGEEFTNFTGTFKLPSGNEKNLNLGGVKFVGTCQGFTSSYTSPNITCLRDKSLDGTQIVEIVASQAETFNGDTTDDWSRPTNSYLPKGTVDYKVGGIVYEAESGNSYYNLRCGKRVYINKKNSPDPNRVTVSKTYSGKLPENNKISLEASKTDGKHSTLTFNTEWKAPFAVELGPQSYANPSKQNYNISSVTYSYIDIKFFYAKGIEGKMSFKNHPLFSSAQITQKEDGCVLRLHLKKTGAFYGWNAEYNKNGQLEFKFLNPPTVTKKNDLTGKKIVIDVGHGGRDAGAPGLRPTTNPESERNLALAKKLKTELESYGATVVLNRTKDVQLTADERCEFLRKQAPDLCISIHHDSSTSSKANGCGVFCFNAFSKDVTTKICDNIERQKIYSAKTKNEWHYFYTARVSICPVVLIENGFISNQGDFAGIIDENTNIRKAKAMTQGVLDYFNSFYKMVANDDDLNYNEEDLNKGDTDKGEGDQTGGNTNPNPDDSQEKDDGDDATGDIPQNPDDKNEEDSNQDVEVPKQDEEQPKNDDEVAEKDQPDENQDGDVNNTTQ